MILGETITFYSSIKLVFLDFFLWESFYLFFFVMNKTKDIWFLVLSLRKSTRSTRCYFVFFFFFPFFFFFVIQLLLNLKKISLLEHVAFCNQQPSNVNAKVILEPKYMLRQVVWKIKPWRSWVIGGWKQRMISK